MTQNNDAVAALSDVSGAKFETLSAIGFTGKSDRECATEIVIAMIHSKLITTADAVSGVYTSVVCAVRAAENVGEASEDVPADPDFEEPKTQEEIDASITPDALISFLDGKPYKTLKRHLTRYGLDPVSYCRRFGLPSTYPMVCASYSAQRAALAKETGLGRSPQPAKQASEASAAAPPTKKSRKKPAA